MTLKKTIYELMNIFTEEKKFIIDGYYRIRTIDDHTVEFAYLIAGPCGDTIAHPQITVSLNKTKLIGTKLIDMYSSPPLFLDRDTLNAHEIDSALDNLIEKFIQAAKNTKTQ
ncbi:hypothetical protein A5821_001858 [Enterococcus sp. 7F3_DIV0205]|uniref:Uncharacterized protein n=1 Tax=Candidatus Enterococcus palustris TaxID=1834189 RepID=A0AAQ3Y7J9_9ENTE|nr:hypothetical protein [Enterococcus sp. 7F3_DIV0205]OTN86246.1 hypothetical protein A5821_002196 [Enterococcus sp. 7F3_DIV0205]